MNSFLGPKNKPCAEVHKSRNQQMGSILPLMALLVALLAALLIGLTRLTHASSQENVAGESVLHSHVQTLFTEAVHFNALANNNLLIADHAKELLETLELLISWGFNLAATTPLWEQRLPIPEKYDLFRKIDLAIFPILRRLDELSSLQLRHKSSLKFATPGTVVHLNLLQSMCSLGCLGKTPDRSASAECNRISSLPNDCHLKVRAQASGSHQQKHLSLRTLLNHTVSQKGGFMLFEVKQILERQPPEIPRALQSKTSPSWKARVGIVHPSLCRHTRKTFQLPCPSPASTRASGSARPLPFALAFEPHWSVAIEF
jgi:hypothetical protein